MGGWLVGFGLGEGRKVKYSWLLFYYHDSAESMYRECGNVNARGQLSKQPPTIGIVVMSICDANNRCHKFTSGATITEESLVGNTAI